MCVNPKEEHKQLNDANQQREIAAQIQVYDQWFTRKFDWELNLAVWVETAKLKSVNIIFARNV